MLSLPCAGYVVVPLHGVVGVQVTAQHEDGIWRIERQVIAQQLQVRTEQARVHVVQVSG